MDEDELESSPSVLTSFLPNQAGFLYTNMESFR